MDQSCPPALVLLRVTAGVLTLSQQAQAGDMAAVAQLEAMAALLEPPLINLSGPAALISDRRA